MNARRHFHSFDALRFLAFAKVFLLHLPLTAFPAFNFFRAGGGTGVSFFFVLSGFLITYLLLEEKTRTGAIDLRRFFIRRILRIWPLYFLLVGFAYLTPWILSWLGLGSSPEGYAPRWYLSLAFLENYEMIRTGAHPNVSPLGVTWSLCIEEHFYLLWGLGVAFLPLRRLPWVASALVVLAFAARFVFRQQGWATIDLLTNVDYFVYGAVPAWLLVMRGPKWEQQMGAIPLIRKRALVLAVLVYVVLSPHLGYPGQAGLEPLVFGVGFAILLALLLPATSGLRISEGNLLSRMGRYTYGLYLYHTVVINLIARVFDGKAWSLDLTPVALAFAVVCFLSTLGVSWLSYRLFELPFIRLKDRFRRRQPVSGWAAPGEGVEERAAKEMSKNS